MFTRKLYTIKSSQYNIESLEQLQIKLVSIFLAHSLGPFLHPHLHPWPSGLDLTGGIKGMTYTWTKKLGLGELGFLMEKSQHQETSASLLCSIILYCIHIEHGGRVIAYSLTRRWGYYISLNKEAFSLCGEHSL